MSNRKAKKLAKRAFDSAIFNRLTSDWLTTSSSADTELWGNLRTLRNRSRDLVRNNDYARSAIRTLTNNVIGQGIALQAQLSQQRGGKLNDRLNDQIEQVFERWCCAEYCDVAGRESFFDLQRLIAKSWFESGEVLVRIVRQPFGDSSVPIAFQILESDQMADETVRMVAPGNEFRMGVEVNEWGRPLFYHLYTDHPGDYLPGTMAPAGRQVIRVPAEEIIHLYVQERPGQTRGIPILHSAILRLRDLGKYEAAELIKARLQAALMGFISNQDMPDIIPGQQQSPQVSKFEPGMIRRLGPGEAFEPFAPTSPGNTYDPYTRSLLRAIASGIGISYETISRDYSQTSFSSARTALVDERDQYRQLQNLFERKVLQPILGIWLEAAVYSGAVNIPTFASDPHAVQQQMRWRKRGWPWIDPSAEVAANKEALKAGLMTASDIIAMSGGDYEDVIKGLKREKDMAAELGLSFDTVMPDAGGGDKGAAGGNAEAAPQDAAPAQPRLLDEMFGAGAKPLTPDQQQRAAALNNIAPFTRTLSTIQSTLAVSIAYAHPGTGQTGR